MTLEPVAATGGTEGEFRAKDMTLRFWIATILTSRFFLLAMGTHSGPAPRALDFTAPNQGIHSFLRRLWFSGRLAVLSAAGIRFAHAT